MPTIFPNSFLDPVTFFVSGGYGDVPGFDPFISYSEIVDMSGQDLTCTQPPYFPYIDTNGGISLQTEDGNPLFCGGGALLNGCWEYQPLIHMWVEGPNMNLPRVRAATVPFTNGTFWVMGGSNEATRDSSELLQNGEFSFGPSLEALYNNASACATWISDDLIFYKSWSAYLFDTTTGTFEDISSGMEFPLYEGSQCGTFTGVDGSRMVVVAGGYETSPPVDYVQIFDVAQRTWRQGPSLPR